MVNKKPIQSKLNSIDLFSGVGGIALGLRAAGIQNLCSIDIDKSCQETHAINFPNEKFILGSVAEIDPLRLRDSLNSEIDLIVGGPPCQGFSLIGLRDPNDERSKLVFSFRHFVSKIRPKFFLMENVPGMLSAEKGQWVRQLLEYFEEDGYFIQQPTTLNAAEFGVPQDRQRVFILGTRKDIATKAQLPIKTHISARAVLNSPQKQLSELPVSPTVWDAIHDLPDVDLYDYLVEDHRAPYASEPKSDYARMMREHGNYGGAFGDIPENWDQSICLNSKKVVHGEVLTQRFLAAEPGTTVPVSRLYKLQWENVANTLRAGTPSSRGSYSSPRPVHPEKPRCITVREGARLQGFPDWFHFHPTKWHGFRQVGNSVSPILAKQIGLEIVKAEAAQKIRP